MACPLPLAGWFPDEDDPPRLPDDPVDEAPTVDVNTPIDVRAAVITAVLELASATVELPFLSPEDLAMFKLSFGRDKDWMDLRQIVRSGLALDVNYIQRQLIELRGPTMYPRLAHLRSLLG